MKFYYIFLLLIFSCNSDYYSRPKGWNRIDLPAKEYIQLGKNYPYYFEYSKYAKILPDTSFKGEPYWITIYYPEHEASIHITYKALENDQLKLRDLIEDSRKLLSKHEVKSYAIKESIYETSLGKAVNFFDLEGEVPSQVQFYVTDSVNNFLRGAVYFNIATRNDSLEPVIQYIRQDVFHLLNTLKWERE